MKKTKLQPLPVLHLHAVDSDDLTVMSAAITCATVKRGDMGFDSKARRFMLVCNRFRWEDEAGAGDRGGSRIRAGLCIHDVESVRAIGVRQLPVDTVLELLSIHAETGENAPEAELTLTFAGGPTLRLKTGCIDALVDDMGRAWYTPNRPRHEEDHADGA